MATDESAEPGHFTQSDLLAIGDSLAVANVHHTAAVPLPPAPSASGAMVRRRLLWCASTDGTAWGFRVERRHGGGVQLFMPLDRDLTIIRAVLPDLLEQLAVAVGMVLTQAREGEAAVWDALRSVGAFDRPDAGEAT